MEAPLRQIPTSCGGGIRKTTLCIPNSPEFEFCNSFPQDNNFRSADQLFSGGVLLPLHHIRQSKDDPPITTLTAPDPELYGSDLAPTEPEISTSESARLASATSVTLSSSKRWIDIFKINDKKSSRRCMDIVAEDHSVKAKDIISSFKEKKREKNKKKNGSGGGSVAAAQLNINIWPFSRSRSYGNAGTRPRSVAASADRKVSSAPCSRSNSTGESKSIKWSSSSPGRGGIHLGRSSPVRQARNGGGGGAGKRSSEAVVRKDTSESRRKLPILNPGGGDGRYKGTVVSCGSEENSAGDVAAVVGSRGCVSSDGARGSNLFNIKNFFTKKVY